jgi:hypothetical protein
VQQLDQDILSWIAVHSEDKNLADQLEHAVESRRDYMRTGFFLYLDTDRELPATNARPVCPHISSPALLDGAGCSLFLRDGYLHYLEVYARGGFMPPDLAEYELGEPV